MSDNDADSNKPLTPAEVAAATEHVAGFLGCFAEDTSYGYFPGGDPRRFHPDPDCSTEEERAQHRADCEAWDAGEQPATPPVHVEIDPTRSIAGQVKGADAVVLERDAAGNVIGGHVTRAGYGLGTFTYTDPQAVEALANFNAICATLAAAEQRALEAEAGHRYEPCAGMMVCIRCGMRSDPVQAKACADRMVELLAAAEKDYEGCCEERQQAWDIIDRQKGELAAAEQRALEAEAACAAMRAALVKIHDLRLGDDEGVCDCLVCSQCTARIALATDSFNRESITKLIMGQRATASDWRDDRAALATDAGKLAAEVLRAADEWERETVAFDTDSKRGPSAAWFNAKGALLAAVRARRGAQGDGTKEGS